MSKGLIEKTTDCACLRQSARAGVGGGAWVAGAGRGLLRPAFFSAHHGLPRGGVAVSAAQRGEEPRGGVAGGEFLT